MSLATGDRLGGYQALAPVGVGGMGEVYRATDTDKRADIWDFGVLLFEMLTGGRLFRATK